MSSTAVRHEDVLLFWAIRAMLPAPGFGNMVRERTSTTATFWCSMTGIGYRSVALLLLRWWQLVPNKAPAYQERKCNRHFLMYDRWWLLSQQRCWWWRCSSKMIVSLSFLVATIAFFNSNNNEQQERQWDESPTLQLAVKAATALKLLQNCAFELPVDTRSYGNNELKTSLWWRQCLETFKHLWYTDMYIVCVCLFPTLQCRFERSTCNLVWKKSWSARLLWFWFARFLWCHENVTRMTFNQFSVPDVAYFADGSVTPLSDQGSVRLKMLMSIKQFTPKTLISIKQFRYTFYTLL